MNPFSAAGISCFVGLTMAVTKRWPLVGSEGPTVYDDRNGLLFCPNGGDGTITAIQLRGLDASSTPATIPTLYGAHALALDTRAHHLFTIAPTAPETPGPYSGPGVPTLLELMPLKQEGNNGREFQAPASYPRSAAGVSLESGEASGV